MFYILSSMVEILQKSIASFNLDVIILIVSTRNNSIIEHVLLLS